MGELDLKGIVWIPKLKKYRVVLTRNFTSYRLGCYADIWDAIKVRDDWLDNYADMIKKEGEDPTEPPKYTKAWFEWKHKKNLTEFKVCYNAPESKVQLITVSHAFSMPLNRSPRHEESRWENTGTDLWAG